MYLLLRRNYWLLLLPLVAGCASHAPFHHEFASGYYASDAESCVPYARRISGLNLHGDADTWWWAAAGHYNRGNRPIAGAVLVLRKTARLRSGHVSVVKEVVSSREINVTHSNWGNNGTNRRIIYESMRAEDVSAANDWTNVRFWNEEHNVFGSPYPAYGFIYP